jgi:hypothetical protein
MPPPVLHDGRRIHAAVTAELGQSACADGDLLCRQPALPESLPNVRWSRGRIAGIVAALAIAGVAAVWYYHPDRVLPVNVTPEPPNPNVWLDQLYSQNPAESIQAARHVEKLGERAVPEILATLEDPRATPGIAARSAGLAAAPGTRPRRALL